MEQLCSASDTTSLATCGKTLLKVNMGGTAIGTGICANPEFGAVCVAALSQISGFEFQLAGDLIEASSCVDAMVRSVHPVAVARAFSCRGTCVFLPWHLRPLAVPRVGTGAYATAAGAGSLTFDRLIGLRGISCSRPP